MLTPQKLQARKQIHDYFIKVARDKNQELSQKQLNISDFVDDNDRKTVLVVLKESIGDIICATSILSNLKKSYKDHDIYFGTDPRNFPVLKGNENIYKAIPYHPLMEQEIAMTGAVENKGIFNVYINLGILNQRQLSYLTNNKISLITEDKGFTLHGCV